MNKEQKELFEKYWYKETNKRIIDIPEYEAKSIWQACLDANKDKMIDIQWPEWANGLVCFYIYNPNIFNISEFKKLLKKDTYFDEVVESVYLISRPVEKWQPKERERIWAFFDGDIYPSLVYYDPEIDNMFIAKFNPENFDAESKMDESDFRERGDFMEAGE